ncbi:hypothetical protein AMA91_002750 [Salmonella enterica subsp. enterica serovar Mbandaka]|uniref:DnaT DNA-binding domain-containing protein n=1 Tax=Salmonella enterica subsp. enterica serovar Bareilly TaxID=58096 RepID=A0A600JG95_SALET|nr:DnaT-like ssDNA-binding domain-containing protein [Salmonella enterica]EAB8412229.1 hypothetical protein [Salmonella enterica subsp. enterica]EBV1512126.1 hypothetical protein [Salmonella enterica subsp. enterica serovar Tennessee]ECB9312015.1 hypothetical protein [Salmonella enterica subsp. enterica serovar Lille]ECJ4335561.1 hypothetical protein [Salmonella enterica subsp. enterica serovar Senftenberg]ECT3107630.1 hypothetical protein [Salmonella enterica subsp. enterica serovar Bareilly]
MASSWIKVEVITPDKPEIFQIAELLNIDPDAVLGKLVRIWAWADQQTIDGNAGSVTKGVLDRIAFITGFADALITVGWLAYVDEKLVLPNFERHNGESSKKRALTNRRVAEHRKRETQNVTRVALQKELPEEEEEEEEDINKTPLSPREGLQISPTVVPGVGEPIGKFTMHDDWQPDPDFLQRAGLWGINLQKPPTKCELAEFTTYWKAEGKAFHHDQWQQKLARSVQSSRARPSPVPRSDVNTVSEPDETIPPGFRG